MPYFDTWGVNGYNDQFTTVMVVPVFHTMDGARLLINSLILTQLYDINNRNGWGDHLTIERLRDEWDLLVWKAEENRELVQARLKQHEESMKDPSIKSPYFDN